MARENTKKKQQVRKQATVRKGANSMKKDTSGKKQVLGRGLSALMAASAVRVDFRPKSSYAAIPSPEALQKSISREQALSRPAGALDTGLLYLPIQSVVANPDQPRKDFSEEELQDLSNSIKKSGLLQPILVRKKGDFQYEIVAGERRYRAAKLAGISSIPALVRDLDERETLELSIVENVQRSDLNPIEEALAYQRLASEFTVSQEDIASAVGKSRSAIANSIRLLKLEQRIQDLIKKGELTSGHARAILMAENSEKAWELAQSILSNKLSVRQAEHNVSTLKSLIKSKKLDAASGAIENRLRRALGTKVVLIRKKKGIGEIRLSFFSEDELQSIVEKIDS